MKRIQLTQGKEALVDDEDYASISKYKWFAKQSRPTSSFYAARWVYQDGERICVWMHREIMQLPDAVYVDHINRNGLDNQRSNMRAATVGQNTANRPLRSDNTSGYRGVSAHKNGRFYVHIRHDGIQQYIGAFATAEDAAHAWDTVARQLHGEFAQLNFPNEEKLP